MSEAQAKNALEEALISFHAGDTDAGEFVQALMTTRAYVLMNYPWDEQNRLHPETRLLLVTDGDIQTQPMLALFTTAERASEFSAHAPQFPHAVKVDVPWAVLGVDDGCGIMLNPNSDTAFRIAPDGAAELRRQVEALLPDAQGDAPLVS